MNEGQSLTSLAERALEFVPDDAVIGLGTGHAATDFVHALGRRLQQGRLRGVRGVPTSEATADLARRLGIELLGFDEVDALDVAFDGADEVDPQCDLIKGFGGSLLRERIVAAAARHFVVLVGQEKLVPALGMRGKLPVEVAPFGLAFCRRRIAALGFPSRPRMNGAQLYVTDNGNYILDCEIKELARPQEVEQALLAVPGTLDTGLFLRMADTVLIQKTDDVEIRRRETGEASVPAPRLS